MLHSIELIPSDPSLRPLCAAVQLKLAPIKELHGLRLPVVLERDFSALPEAERSQVMRDTCAAYRRSTRTIYINKSTFSALDPEVMQAVLAHEIGHAHAHDQGLMDKLTQYQELGSFGEEFLADRFACVWGFEHGLVKERAASYKDQYVKALSTWPDEAVYCQAMDLWRMKRIAGVV